MKRPLIAPFLLLATTHLPAGVLYSPEGTRSTTPGPAVADMPLATAIATPTFRYDNGGQLIAQAVTQAERIARKPAARDATSAQRDHLQSQKNQALRGLAQALIGRSVTLSIEVLDVVNRPMPAEPQPLAANPTTADRQSHAATLRAYEDEIKHWTQTSMMVIGRIERTGRSAQSAEYRKQLAALNDKLAQDLEDLTRTHLVNDPRQPNQSPTEYTDKKLAIREKHRQALAALREQFDADLAHHTVYLVGPNASFATWRRGQTRACSGVIFRAGLFPQIPRLPDPAAPQLVTPVPSGPTEDDVARTLINLELAVRATPDPSPAARP